MLLQGQNAEAEKLVYEHFTCKGSGSGYGSGKDVQYGSYQTLGSLRIRFPSIDSQVSDYRRELNLTNAIARVEYRKGDVKYRREAFVSAPAQVIVVRLAADKPGKIDFEARLDRPERFTASADGTNGLLMAGQLNNGTDGKGMKYAVRLRAINKGGDVSVSDNTLRVSHADEVVLQLSAATDYMGFAGRRTKEPLPASLLDLQKAASKTFDTLRADHIRDYQRYFNRVSLELGRPNSTESLSTTKRLQAYDDGSSDPAFAALYFQYGRYLLISSSRPGGLPANLQGIWAEEVQTPWNGDWHLNVNVQMNYWPAETTNLSELHEPLFQLINSLQTPGARTARLYYHARGWVAHVITNPWGFTSPGEGASWGSTTSGSAWLCEHLWDHYLFTRDRAFLKWAYPIMKGSARFYADMLIEEPTHKWLVTAPANSPENAFILPDGKVAHVVMGPTIDMQLLRYLFGACIEASQLLGIDREFRSELIDKKKRLAPTRIGSDGRVMEWLQEYKEAEPTHRHVSHLWGLYPGSEITSDGTPDLARAARKSLDVRGDLSTGWSLAYKVNLWARLGDGNRANRLLSMLLSPVGSRERQGGGSYENLFDAHPPFQIDGNFGATAGIAEMLLQSRDDRIELLPALPDAWQDGRLTGLRARGGYELEIKWKQGKLVEAKLKSTGNGHCMIRYGQESIQLKTEAGKSYSLARRLGGY